MSTHDMWSCATHRNAKPIMKCAARTSTTPARSDGSASSAPMKKRMLAGRR